MTGQLDCSSVKICSLTSHQYAAFPQLKGNSFKMTITLGGRVSINCIYYIIFSKVLCVSFCQILSLYQDSPMENPANTQRSEIHQVLTVKEIIRICFETSLLLFSRFKRSKCWQSHGLKVNRQDDHFYNSAFREIIM